jgi:transposase
VYHLSRRTTVGVLRDLFGVPLSVGALSACEQTVSAAVAHPVAEAHAYAQEHDGAVHADETGWRERRQRAWLWVLVSPLVTVFLVHAQRGTVAARALLGECLQAILVSDRWSAYAFWATEQRQVCWAHLLREFQAFTERGGAAARVGRALQRETKLMFAWWAQVRDGTRSRRQFWLDMRPVRRRVEAQLRRGVARADAKTAATCRDLLARAPALWTFVDLPDVEPTNNAAERALRSAVLWRKNSFGSHSPAGSRFAERMLTIAATLKQQHRNVVDYLTEACVAALHGKPAPSLLPTLSKA